MEIETMGSIAALMLIIIVPVILIKMNKAKVEKRLLKPLQQFAKNNNSIIMEFDLWSDTVIGIDTNTQLLFFKRTTKESQMQQTVQLQEIKKCNLFNSNRITRTAGDTQISIEKIELVFSYQNQSRADVVLEFYNAKYDNLTINDELQLAEKWRKIVSFELEKLHKTKA